MSSFSLPKPLLRLKYERSAQEYLRSLPLEHFMEATSQATQREITLESLALVRAQRSDVHVFNELLVQYPLPDDRIGKVVPDNMIVLHDGSITAEGSYNVPFQPAKPFWMLEYVSKSSERKDYDDNIRKYEQELKTPYYLLFAPEEQEMNLFHRSKAKYVSVRPNRHGRCPIKKLELEVGLLDGWVRFWFRGELLPLPADLFHALERAQQELAEAQRRAEEEARRAEEERQMRMAAENEAAQLRAEIERLRGQ